jgi:titin
VYRGTRAGAETLLTSIGTALSYTDTSARSGTTYYYRLAAVNATGESALSNEAAARAR